MDYFSKVCAILFIIGLFAIPTFGQKPKYNKAKTKCAFVAKEARYTNSKVPTWEWESKSGVVRDAKSVATLAYAYAVNLYGEEMAKKEQPYTVNTLNDS